MKLSNRDRPPTAGICATRQDARSAPSSLRALLPWVAGGVGAGPCLVFLALVLSTASAAVDDVIRVERYKTDLYKGKGITTGRLTTVTKGAQLKVLVPSDEKKWLKVATTVEARDLNGFVNEVALKGGKSEGQSMNKLFPNLNERTQVSEAAAAKGIEPQTLAYSRNKNLNPDILRTLRQRRDSVTEEDFQKFAADLKTGH